LAVYATKRHEKNKNIERKSTSIVYLYLF